MTDDASLRAQAQALRNTILTTVSHTGGHLASSLGVVELTLVLTRLFNPAVDRIVWDVSHQTYAWKLLTDRSPQIQTLRQFKGLSGFTNPSESPCDAFVAGHAGTALAVAQGFACARAVQHISYHVVAVVGEASLMNGESLEALHAFSLMKTPVIVIVNDNASPMRDMRSFLTAFGLDFLGSVDGHDFHALEEILLRAQKSPVSCAVHVRTIKGKGFAPAESDPAFWHGTSPFDLSHPPVPSTVEKASPWSWSTYAGHHACTLAAQDPRICALTAAMRLGTGLSVFAQKFPSRFFDFGICEEHLVTFAAALAKGGLRPLVFLYSTFLQRAVDQIIHDVCILKLPVIFCVDRAGCVGHDGVTHQGLYDLALLRGVPNLTICQGATAREFQTLVSRALKTGGPWVIRYPRGTVPERETPICDLSDAWSVQLNHPEASLQIWALGDYLFKALEVQKKLAEHGVTVGVVNACFVKPVDKVRLASQRARGCRIISLENATVMGGLGEALGADLKLGWPDQFIPHGSVAELEEQMHLDVPHLVTTILETKELFT